MQFFGVVLFVTYAVLLAKCEDQRILEDEDDRPQYNETDVKSISSDDDTLSNLRDLDLPPPSRLAAIRANCSLPEDLSNASIPIRPECLMRADSLEPAPTNPDNLRRTAADANNEETQGVDTEVADLLNPTEDQQGGLVVEHQHPLEPELPMHIADKIQKQAELIEDGEITEDVLRSHRNENVSESSHGPLAVVLVSLLVALSVVCYAALLLWRKYLENRYGSRTLLVNAEEIPDPSDMKHFSI